MNPNDYFKALDERRNDYRALPMQPLRIECVLRDSVIHFDNLHLDAILASTVSEEILQGAPFPAATKYVGVPVPLQVAWVNEAGVPLYACSDLRPEGERIRDTVYFHSRALSPTMTKESLETGTGRYQEKRSALPLTVNREWSATALGNADEIARLLGRVTAIGKKHSSKGAVGEWRVQEIDAFAFVDGEGRAVRPLPLAYVQDNGSLLDGSYISFSPPYWHAETKALCVPCGGKL